MTQDFRERTATRLAILRIVRNQDDTQQWRDRMENIRCPRTEDECIKQIYPKLGVRNRPLMAGIAILMLGDADRR